MKLKEILESGLIRDDHRICVDMKLFGNRKTVAAGKWFQDQILDLMDRKVVQIEYDSFLKLWTFTLADGIGGKE